MWSQSYGYPFPLQEVVLTHCTDSKCLSQGAWVWVLPQGAIFVLLCFYGLEPSEGPCLPLVQVILLCRVFLRDTFSTEYVTVIHCKISNVMWFGCDLYSTTTSSTNLEKDLFILSYSGVVSLIVPALLGQCECAALMLNTLPLLCLPALHRATFCRDRASPVSNNCVLFFGVQSLQNVMSGSKSKVLLLLVLQYWAIQTRLH